jgi:iron complex transport system substrate-binding protein
MPSGTETLFALGLGHLLVGVSHACDWPAATASLPRLTRSRIDGGASGQEIDDQVRALMASGQPLYEVDTELLADLCPDLIVTQSQCDVCAVRYDDVVRLVADRPALRSTRVLGLNPRRLEETIEDAVRLAEAAGPPAAGVQLAEQLRARIDAVREKTMRRPAVVVACLEWLDPPMLAGNWGPELVELAGGIQPLTQAGAHSTYTDWPSIIAGTPQAIVVCPCGFDLERSAAEARSLNRVPGWTELGAVREGRVYALDGNTYFNRPGPRLIDTLELLAHLLHPEVCAPPANGLWRRVVPSASA